MQIKKIIKRSLIVLTSILSLFLIVVAFLLNFIFTPERITPQAIKIINENLDAKVACESIELTFFSSFPHFGIKLKEGSVVTAAVAGQKPDTLAQFELCKASFNIDKLLRKHNLIINNLTLTQPKIRAIINEKGKANWNIVKPSAPDTTTVKDTTSTFEIKSIYVKKLIIEGANLTYNDHVTQAKVHMDNFNMILKAANTDKKLVLSVESDGKNIGFTKSGLVFAKKLKAAFQTQIHYDKVLKHIDFSKSELKLNDVDFLADGHFKLDSVNKQVHTDIALTMKVPSLKTLWETVPAHIIKKKDIEVQGNVALKATAKGIYGKDRFPTTDIVFKIDKGSLKYKKFPGVIDRLEADMHSVINFDNPTASNVTVNHLLIEGTGINLNGTAKIENLLKNPQVDTNIKGDLNITTIKKAFPVNKAIDAKGTAQLDLNAIFNVNELKNSNFNNLKLKGNSVFSNLLISAPKDSIYIETQKTELAFGRKSDDATKKAFGRISISDLKAKYKSQHDLTLKGLDIKFKAKKLKDSVAALSADIRFTNLKYTGADKLKAVIRNANATADLNPKSTKENPVINTSFTVDSAGVWQDKKFVGIKNGNYTFVVRKNKEDKWMPRGHVEFNNLYAYTPEFGLPLRMQHSKISVNNRAITLKDARLTFGNSDVTLTGKINNLFAKRTKENNIDAQLTLNSNYIDANEIMKILHDQPEKQPDFTKQKTVTTKQTPVTSEKTIFKIPKNINFTFNSAIDKLRFGTLNMTNIKGLLRIEDGHVKLNNFELETLAAKLSTSIKYTAIDDKEASIDFDFNLNDIEMANISKIMPALDSLFPMARSFEGKAHLRMQGTAKLNEKMEVIIPSVKSIAALQASNIMVLDSQTFREMAKTLMFKSKEKNTIETLNMEMIIEKSHMEVLPALVEIDRYRLAIGGTQNLDLSYNYHVSVLKSPIPFKTGVDIKGDMKDYHISLTKAKYKYYFTDKERLQEKADMNIVNKKKDILSRLDFK